MADEGDVYLAFNIYRWAGTSPAEFRKHYIDVHAPLVRRVPGVVWYEAFLNKDVAAEWPITAAPSPDAVVVLKFASEQAKEQGMQSQAWSEAAADSAGFISHFDVFRPERLTWVPDASPRVPFGES
ncbi:EthD domain-containing protein [Prauserella muralis]|uniref:Uncharacterized protein n=1 Tax=Prauserella muralis TaxID=588067 RepID=A0A2V4ATE8_9PSEU|nr:EthD domain-containing protein [Prauserella muralis]PXY24696.1 hypothetical protein BAY60_19520 [Prauserella muralis]TWE27611.1 uncharacterized protein (TIGR02118 family) [Prauserella muralis]